MLHISHYPLSYLEGDISNLPLNTNKHLLYGCRSRKFEHTLFSKMFLRKKCVSFLRDLEKPKIKTLNYVSMKDFFR